MLNVTVSCAKTMSVTQKCSCSYFRKIEKWWFACKFHDVTLDDREVRLFMIYFGTTISINLL
jgi:hypothetical protein